MTTLRIERFSATAHVGADRAGAEDALDRLVADVTGRRLDEALDRAGLPGGEWFVDRIGVRLEVDLADPGPAADRQWAEQVVAAVGEALAAGTAVYFADAAEAVADLVAGCATGRLEHGWVWRQAGLVGGGWESAPLTAVLTALSRRPELVVAALVRALDTAGAPALHRLFGSREASTGATGWSILARLLFMAHGAGPDQIRPLGELPATAGDARSAAADRPALASATRRGEAGRADRDLADRAAAVVGAAAVAAVLRRSRLRLDGEAALGWAVLAIAEADPGALSHGFAATLIRAVAAQLSGPSAAAVTPPVVGVERRPGTGAGLEMPPGVAATHAETSSAAQGDDRTRRRAEADDDRAAVPTAWAGLLFLLTTAADADIPGAILRDPALTARPLAWVLHTIGRIVVPAAADDPAVLALAGLTPADDPPSSAGPPATDEERERIAGHADRWVRATAARLPAAQADPGATVAGLARRPGLVRANRGWIDIELALALVDLDIRRAGLDIDPGWLAWLGTVVRFRYV